MVILYHNNNDYANKIDLTPIVQDQSVCARKVVLDMDSLRRKMEIALWTDPSERQTLSKLGIYCPTPVPHRKKVVGE